MTLNLSILDELTNKYPFLPPTFFWSCRIINFSEWTCRVGPLGMGFYATEMSVINHAKKLEQYLLKATIDQQDDSALS